MNSAKSGNFRRRGGPNFSPDQTRSDFPSSSTMVISKDPLLITAPAGFISDSMSLAARLEEASNVMYSLARFLKTCQDLQWTMETCYERENEKINSFLNNRKHKIDGIKWAQTLVIFRPFHSEVEGMAGISVDSSVLSRRFGSFFLGFEAFLADSFPLALALTIFCAKNSAQKQLKT